jgi:hypothetical protein
MREDETPEAMLHFVRAVTNVRYVWRLRTVFS